MSQISTLEQWREKAKQLQAELIKVQEDIENDQAAQIDEKARDLEKICTENQQLKNEFDKIKERSKKLQLQFQQSEKDKQMLSQSIRRNDDELNEYKGQIVKLQIDNDELRNQLR